MPDFKTLDIVVLPYLCGQNLDSYDKYSETSI